MKESRKGGRWTVRLGAFAATVFVAAGLALGARKVAEKTVLKPSYTIPNIAAVAMCLSVLAISCKRFKRT
jgi:hypothetical protein